jgi:(2Fe-2S) ferredoxin
MFRPSRYVWVCTKRRPDGSKKGSCAEQGSEELVRVLKSAARKAELDVRVTSSGCFDLCWVGPAVAIMPDGVFLKRVATGDAAALVEALSAGPSSCPLGPALAEKLALDRDFEDPTREKAAADVAPSASIEG